MKKILTKIYERFSSGEITEEALDKELRDMLQNDTNEGDKK